MTVAGPTRWPCSGYAVLRFSYEDIVPRGGRPELFTGTVALALVIVWPPHGGSPQCRDCGGLRRAGRSLTRARVAGDDLWYFAIGQSQARER